MRKVMTGTILGVLLLGGHDASAADPVCGDVNMSSTVTSSDALLVLRKSVDQPVTLDCSAFEQQPPAQTLKTGSSTGFDGALQAGAPRSFTDNGDGTITDNTTGLMWEKKDDSGGIHDKDNVYNWEAVRCEQNLNGTILTGFLATLNAGDGFAGYTDWRIPNRFELESLLNFADPTIPENSAKVYPVFQTGCEAACTVTTCSCTAPLATWTSTDEIAGACLAYLVDFYSTFSTSDWKDVEYPVRAVRTAF
jgi:hypothetical protein